MSHLPNQENLPSLPNRPTCCSLARFATPALVLVTAVSLATAAYFAGRSTQVSQMTGASQNALTSQTDQLSQALNSNLESLGLPPLHATASVTSEKYSMSTGFVSEDVEGLFVLDHNSGLLQCNVLYPRSPAMGFAGRFSINIADALGTGAKGGQYIMVTGVARFPRASNRPAAETVVYVMDTASGNYAGYGVPFDRSAMNGNRPQQGLLVLIASGSANPIVDRDNLR